MLLTLSLGDTTKLIVSPDSFSTKIAKFESNEDPHTGELLRERDMQENERTEEWTSLYLIENCNDSIRYERVSDWLESPWNMVRFLRLEFGFGYSLPCCSCALSK